MAPPSESQRYRLTLAYVGSRFAGWQRQPNATTVQEIVETALADLVGAQVALTGAGRTDAGVHARGQVAHFDAPPALAPAALVHGTNHRLPEEIRVLSAAPASAAFHARFSAEAKEYRYRLVRGRFATPAAAPFALAVPERLDVTALRSATLHLPGRHDFAAFALAGGAHTTSRRTILAAGWIDEPPDLTLRIVGDGFLRGMVRGLVGTLLEVALGRRTAGSFATLLAGATRADAGPTAPAHGLSLERVFYRPPPTRSEAIAVVTSTE